MFGFVIAGLFWIGMAFKNWTIFQTNRFGPFKYQTCSVFKPPLYLGIRYSDDTCTETVAYLIGRFEWQRFADVWDQSFVQLFDAAAAAATVPTLKLWQRLKLWHRLMLSSQLQVLLLQNLIWGVRQSFGVPKIIDWNTVTIRHPDNWIPGNIWKPDQNAGRLFYSQKNETRLTMLIPFHR